MKDAFCWKLYYAKVFTRIEACIFATQSLPLFSVEKVMVKKQIFQFWKIVVTELVPFKITDWNNQLLQTQKRKTDPDRAIVYKSFVVFEIAFCCPNHKFCLHCCHWDEHWPTYSCYFHWGSSMTAVISITWPTKAKSQRQKLKVWSCSIQWGQ